MERLARLLIVGALGCESGGSMDADASGSPSTSGPDATETSTPTTSTDDPSLTSVDPSATSSSGDSGSGESSETTGGPVDPPDCGSLQGLPSEPGPHVAEIEALPDDSWLALGPPAPDPLYGGGRGRSWGGRAFALAPELDGAFFTGEGVHAYVKPDGFGMDDIFFYDINAHAWITIHPGVDTANFNQQVADGELSIDDNGQLVDAFGDPVPLHVLIHAWGFLTYDPDTRRFVMLAGDGMGRYFMPGGEDLIDEGLTALEEMRAGATVPPMSPWFYSTTDCRWERYPVPSAPTGDELFVLYPSFAYASASSVFVMAGQAGVSEFDPIAGAWTTIEDSGPRPMGYDHGTAYDSTRNRLYLGGGSGFESDGVFVYSIDDATWTKAASAGVPSISGTNSSSMFYDTTNDVVTVFHYGDGMHYTYAPDEDTWTSQPLPAEVLSAVGYPSFNAFYDPGLNAYFVFAATDSEDNGTMWAYRWRSG